MTQYRSAHHPGDTSAAIVFARSQIRPIALCLLPLMIIASVGALTQIDPLRFLAWSVPLAYVAASSWTIFSLRRLIAEIEVGGGSARLRSVWDVAANRAPSDWAPVLGAKETGYSVLAAIGYAVYELEPEHWPELETLRRDLRRASRRDHTTPADPAESDDFSTLDPSTL